MKTKDLIALIKRFQDHGIYKINYINLNPDDYEDLCKSADNEIKGNKVNRIDGSGGVEEIVTSKGGVKIDCTGWVEINGEWWYPELCENKVDTQFTKDIRLEFNSKLKTTEGWTDKSQQKNKDYSKVDELKAMLSIEHKSLKVCSDDDESMHTTRRIAELEKKIKLIEPEFEIDKYFNGPVLSDND